MHKFDAIRFFHDTEINDVLQKAIHHPMVKTMMNFTFPGMPDEEWKAQLSKTHSIRDFQCNFIYHTVKKVLEKSSEGLSSSGFEKLEDGEAYLFISNHRDILLDTTLLNTCLFEHNLVMTASAIGNNLVKKPFLHTLAMLNRNFLVMRDLSPREMLQSSKLLSEYIYHLLHRETRSVWIAQREGRTKDGNDQTNPGLLKMIGMGSDEADLTTYFKKLRIVPVSISYEYDPTDAMKMPQLIAEANNEVYVKNRNEDFMNIVGGAMGPKKRIHIHIGDVLDTAIDKIAAENDNANKQIQALAQVIDDSIIQNYHLWPTNFIAYDIREKENRFAHKYTEAERQLFERRMEMRIDTTNEIAVNGFLAMYANPVVNRLKYTDEL